MHHIYKTNSKMKNIKRYMNECLASILRAATASNLIVF